MSAPTAMEYNEVIALQLDEADDMFEWLDDQLEVKPLFAANGLLDRAEITITMGGPSTMMTVYEYAGTIETHWGDSHVWHLTSEQAERVFAVVLECFSELS